MHEHDEEQGPSGVGFLALLLAILLTTFGVLYWLSHRQHPPQPPPVPQQTTHS